MAAWNKLHTKFYLRYLSRFKSEEAINKRHVKTIKPFCRVKIRMNVKRIKKPNQ